MGVSHESNDYSRDHRQLVVGCTEGDTVATRRQGAVTVVRDVVDVAAGQLLAMSVRGQNRRLLCHAVPAESSGGWRRGNRTGQRWDAPRMAAVVDYQRWAKAEAAIIPRGATA